MLTRIGSLLEEEGGNRHKVTAYYLAAENIRKSEKNLSELYVKRGREGLERIRGIGSSIAGVIAECLDTGRSSLLDRLRGEHDPVELFSGVAGIGDELAVRIRDQLSITSLEELEQAAHDGRLESVEGFGEERVRAVREVLASRLSGSGRGGRTAGGSESRGRRRDDEGPEAPPEELLLEIDREYREKADRGELKYITPKRFNPEGKKWLPIYETSRKGWTFTVLYSNTPRAHKRGKTDDWVVIYFSDGKSEDQRTVITAESGKNAGERVIAGE